MYREGKKDFRNLYTNTSQKSNTNKTISTLINNID